MNLLLDGDGGKYYMNCRRAKSVLEKKERTLCSHSTVRKQQLKV